MVCGSFEVRPKCGAGCAFLSLFCPIRRLPMNALNLILFIKHLAIYSNSTTAVRKQLQTPPYCFTYCLLCGGRWRLRGWYRGAAKSNLIITSPHSMSCLFVFFKARCFRIPASRQDLAPALFKHGSCNDSALPKHVDVCCSQLILILLFLLT